MRVSREAIRLFAARGFDGVSVSDIAEACDMTQANLYRYASSKQNLARDLFLQGYRSYGDRLAHVVAGLSGPLEQIDAIIRVVCELHDEDRDMFRFLLITQHSFLRDVPRDDRNPLEMVVRLLRDGMEMGLVPVAEPELLALAIIGLVVQAAVGCLYRRLAGDLRERAGIIVQMAHALVGAEEALSSKHHSQPPRYAATKEYAR